MKNNNNKWKKFRQGNEDIKEGFCGLCLAVPLAFAGVGASAYGAKKSSRGKYKKQKKIALYVGIVSVIISLIIAAYYFFSCKTCR